MIYKEFNRYNIGGCLVTKVTDYVTTVHHETPVVKYRYAFEQLNTGQKFVYTGVNKGFKVGDVHDIRGTVKSGPDKYGYIRLSRIRKIEMERELPL